MMFVTLIKKQFTDIFQSFFIDKKNGEAKTKKKTVSSIVFFIIVMVFVMGGLFFNLAFTLCSTLVSLNLDWMYFMILTITSVTLGTFGSVFNTFSTLYKAKDNDLLLSLPIPAKYIILSRLSGVYLLGLMYSMIVFIPAQIVYFINKPLSFSALLSTVIFGIIISIIDLVISCALGWIVAKISLKVKNKSIITVITALVFFGVYYFFAFKSNELISRLLVNALEISDTIIGKAYVLYFIGNAAAGNLFNLLICAAVSALLAFGAYMIIAKSFFKIASSSQKEKKAVYREKKVKEKSALGAFISKEFTHFIGNPNYILNCGLGTILIPVGTVILAVKGQALLQAINGNLPELKAYIMPIAAALMCFMSTMNDISAPSISLEGKNIWIAQSLPVDTWTVLESKFYLHILLTETPVFICSVIISIILKLPVLQALTLIIFVSSFVCLNALTGLFTNLKSPNLTWTNETIAIKQGMSVLVAILGSWGYVVVLGILCYLSSLVLSPALFIFIAAVINIILCLLLVKWLKKKGTRIFESL